VASAFDQLIHCGADFCEQQFISVVAKCVVAVYLQPDVIGAWRRIYDSQSQFSDC